MRREIRYDRVDINLLDDVITITRRLIAFDDDDSEIGARTIYEVLKPGDDVSSQPLKIRKLTVALWT